MKNQKNYFIYCRSAIVDETNIIRQGKTIEDYVIKNGLNVTKTFIDMGGSNDDFKKMIRMVKRGGTSGIIVMDESRISRDPSFRYEILEVLEKGLIDEIRTMKTIYRNDTTSKGLLFFGILASEDFRKMMSEKIKKGIVAKKAKKQETLTMN